LRVDFFPEALAELEARRRWWRENRDEEQLFDEELAVATKALEERATTFPVFVVLGQRRVYRILMKKTRCHLYFEIAGDVVMVVSAWGATRERTPHV
jgi:hypothetical protein